MQLLGSILKEGQFNLNFDGCISNTLYQIHKVSAKMYTSVEQCDGFEQRLLCYQDNYICVAFRRCDFVRTR